MEELLKRAETGEIAAIEEVANSYYRGLNGFPEDNERALYWYGRAVELDPSNVIGLNGLGNIYYHGYGVPVDIEKGVAYYTKGAALGYGKSQFNLASYLESQNDPKCIEWYEKAFENGNPDAAYKLYLIYTKDSIVDANISKQLEWLEKGAEANDSDCQLALGCEYLPNGHCEENYDMARKWWIAAADNGVGTAMNNLSIMYENGQGVESDFDTALEWAIKAAKNGDAGQLRRYAFLYEDGSGFLPKSPEKAAELMKVGADAGDEPCLTHLGIFYLKGTGVEANEEEALHCFEAAGKKGSKLSLDAIKAIGPRVYGENAAAKYYEIVKEGADDGYYECMVRAYRCLESGEGVPVNTDAAIEYLERAARGGYKEALFYLGVEHLNGKLIRDANPKTAAELFEKVIDLGEPDGTTAAAQRNLALMYKEGLGVGQDLEKAISYLEKAADNGNIDALLKAALAHDDGGWANLDYEKACHYYAQLAETDNAVAITNLAFNYERGAGVPKDIAKAVELYEKGSQLGDVRAMTNLASLYQNDEDVGKNETRAIELLAKAANQGYPRAEILLGFAYYEGKGVPANLEEALRLWEAAAEQGDVTAHDLVGKAYTDKAFKPFINYEKAAAYFRPLAEQGDAGAAYHLADSLEEISAWDEANNWLVKAAEGGSVEAQSDLGIRAWLRENYAEAVKWLQPAAEKGNAGALFCMANMLMNGNSAIAKDEVKAFQYYSKASEQGNLRAMYELGRCYYYGLGTSIDYNMAFKLFSNASQNGSDDMWLELGNCYLEGNGVGKDVNKAIECYKRGIEKTDCDYCRMRLGILYADQNSGYFSRSLAEECLIPLTKKDQFRGDAAFRLGMLCGSVGDKQESVRWFMMASDENHAAAQYNLGVIYFNGELGARDFDKAEQFFTLAAHNGHPNAASDAADCRAMKARMNAQTQQPVQTSSSGENPKSGGCYIATAVYGSYDCPEVWILRRFRDYTLAETWYGLLFIKLYYAISPKIVRWFGNAKWFNYMWRKFLDRVIASLKQRGIDNTPYDDRAIF